MPRLGGSVKFFNPEKGYGFIVGNDRVDYFVHITSASLIPTLIPTSRTCTIPTHHRLPSLLFLVCHRTKETKLWHLYAMHSPCYPMFRLGTRRGERRGGGFGSSVPFCSLMKWGWAARLHRVVPFRSMYQTPLTLVKVFLGMYDVTTLPSTLKTP